MSEYESPFSAEFALIDLSYGGRTLQMRPSQLTTTNIARAFRLIPDTIILVSERDTVALPQDGVFHDVDDCYTWIVEGEKSTTNMSVAGGGHGSTPSWIKSIDLCSFDSSNEIVAYSEYPVKMDENNAKVSSREVISRSFQWK